MNSLDALPADVRAAVMPGPGFVKPSAVIEDVCAEWGMDPKKVCGRDRTERVSTVRAACVLAVRTLCPEVSYAVIGSELGGRDHSTIMFLERRALLRMAEISSAEPAVGTAAGGNA